MNVDKMLFSTVLLALAATVFAIPTKRSTTISAADILRIDPSTSSACAPGLYASECRTAVEAAPLIAESFANFSITTFGEQAALVAEMMFESGSFKYAINHFPSPGTPGQGTRNMQTPNYNVLYAQWLSTVCTNCGITAAQVQQATTAGPDAVLSLVNTDQWSFSSAAWFLVTQCPEDVRKQLATGTLAGWQAYMGPECVHAGDVPQRDQLWKAINALGQW